MRSYTQATININDEPKFTYAWYKLSASRSTSLFLQDGEVKIWIDSRALPELIRTLQKAITETPPNED